MLISDIEQFMVIVPFEAETLLFGKFPSKWYLAIFSACPKTDADKSRKTTIEIACLSFPKRINVN